MKTQLAPCDAAVADDQTLGARSEARHHDHRHAVVDAFALSGGFTIQQSWQLR